jgi:F0F1-type ATP synthase assembly protein I
MDSESPNDSLDAKKEKKEIHESFREYGPYLTLGFQLAAAVLVFFFVGYWFDSRFHTTPLGILLGVGLGFTGGFYKFIKSVAEIRTEKKKMSSARED